jgi:hypothetical protein
MGKSRYTKQLQTHNERPLTVRYRKACLSAPVKQDLHVEFTESGLTSYAGLELLIRYFRSIRLNDLIRRHVAYTQLGGDYGTVAMIRIVLGLLIVGGRRIRHLDFVRGDVLFERFAGLIRIPSLRTLSRWLTQFTMQSIQRLQALNAEIVARIIRNQPLRTLTVDVDGSVVSTGQKVERAFRGFNPHHRKVPSYYPITAYLAETGQILRVKNRSGNVHDGKASITFLRDLFIQIQETIGNAHPLNFRMDGAFFHPKVLKLLLAKGAGFCIKVPFWKWLDLKGLIKTRRRWHRVNNKVACFETNLTVWDATLRVVIYRKKVFHRSRKNYQLDLFDPNDGYYEYSAIATNLSFPPRQLINFMDGRGEHEKVIGQLKGQLALDTIPTSRYGANSAWQQIVAIVHNLLVSFQIDTGALRRNRTEKRTCLYELKTAQTLRFELFNRAGRVVRPNGTTVLRLSRNSRYRDIFIRTARALKVA